MKPKAEKKVPEKKPEILNQIFQQKAFVDFRIVSQPSKGKPKSFPCHRVVLAAQSTAMRKYLVEDMQEEGGQGELELFYSNNVVEKFVKFFQTRRVAAGRLFTKTMWILMSLH